MGAGGIIIIRNLAESPEIPEADRKALHAIADRNPIRPCRRRDALRVLRILWKYLRP